MLSCLEPIEPRTLFSSHVGILDTSFASAGLSQISLPNQQFAPAAMVAQPDGKLLVAGTVTPSAGSGNSDFLLLRLNPDGSLDPSFHSTGMLTLDFQSTNDIAAAFSLQSNGKILVLGSSEVPGADPIADHPNTDLAIARLNSDGSLDPSFHSTGMLTLDLSPLRFKAYGNPIQENPTADLATSAAQLASGKILVSGTMFADDFLAGDMFILRLNADGSVDPSFGYAASGLAPAPFAGDTAGNAMLVQSDGKIVLAGADTSGRQTQIALIRYNAAGQYDTSFGTGGHLAFAFSETFDSAFALAQQPDGKLLIGGTVTRSPLDKSTAFSELALIRLAKNGKPDKSFGPQHLDGLVLTPIKNYAIASITSLHVQSNGSILVGGKAATLDDALSLTRTPFVARFTSKGVPDSSFGAAGFTLLPSAHSTLTTATPKRTDDYIVGSLDNEVGTQAQETAYRAFLDDPTGSLVFIPTGSIRTFTAGTSGASDSLLTIAALTSDGIDLTGSLTYKPPAHLNPKAKQSAQLILKNIGTLPAAGHVKVSLYLSPTSTLPDGAQPFSSSIVNANLKPGKSSKSTLKFSLPPNLSPGNYTLIALLTPQSGAGPDLNPNNNTLFSNKQITLN